ncbi:Hypothetical predicted protein, partial [Xyrichtys novacula]
ENTTRCLSGTKVTNLSCDIVVSSPLPPPPSISPPPRLFRCYSGAGAISLTQGQTPPPPPMSLVGEPQAQIPKQTAQQQQEKKKDNGGGGGGGGDAAAATLVMLDAFTCAGLQRERGGGRKGASWRGGGVGSDVRDAEKEPTGSGKDEQNQKLPTKKTESK